MRVAKCFRSQQQIVFVGSCEQASINSGKNYGREWSTGWRKSASEMNLLGSLSGNRIEFNARVINEVNTFDNQRLGSGSFSSPIALPPLPIMTPFVHPILRSHP